MYSWLRPGSIVKTTAAKIWALLLPGGIKTPIFKLALRQIEADWNFSVKNSSAVYKFIKFHKKFKKFAWAGR